jgi:phytoene dehydrogenase-like protein
MNGYRTVIFESYKKPGGLCTSWKRGPYTVDGCIHWLVGSSPKNSFHQYWQELGAVQNRNFIDHEELYRYENRMGETFVLHSDLDNLERHMLEISPQDGEPIRHLIRNARAIAKIDALPKGYRKLFFLPFLIPRLFTYSRMSVERYAQRFKSPFLREALPNIIDLPDFPMIAFFFLLAWLHNRTAGYPIGGSLEFSRAIETRFKNLGGTIHYQSPVEKIIVKKGRAAGVRLKDGREEFFDRVISAADGHATLFEMLGEAYLDDKIKKIYKTTEPFPPLLYAAFGVARDFSQEPPGLTFPADPAFEAAGVKVEKLSIRHFSYDPTMAPAGKSVIIVACGTEYAPWKRLAGNPKEYRAEKERVLQNILECLEKRYPVISAQVELKELGTPLTFERYTGNWKGSFEGWLPTTKTLFMRIPVTLKKVKDFYMTGQWVRPGGGLPTAVDTSRRLIERICKEDGKIFDAFTPEAKQQIFKFVSQS